MKTITQVFYTSKQALQIQLSANGIFFEIAPVMPGAERKYNWKVKKGSKFSVSELCNLSYAMENFRIFGEKGYIEISQTICGERYKNMQFIHKNRRNEDVRTGLNFYNNSLSFIINNQKAGVNLNFPILATERLRLERFLNRIIDVCLTEPDEYERENVNEKDGNSGKNKKALEQLSKKLYSKCASHSEIDMFRSQFFKYCWGKATIPVKS